MKDFKIDSRVPVIDDEDEKTLAAIDEGIRDADAGRAIPIKEVRKRLRKRVTDSSSRGAR